MKFVTLDFETFYSKEYSLSKLRTEAYVRDPRFEVILVGAKVNDHDPVWFSGTMEETKAWLESLDLPNAILLCHNTAFDGFILSYHFGIKARFYMDTMCMARPKHGQTMSLSLKSLSDHYTVGVKGEEVVLAMGKRRTDFTHAEMQAYGQYCVNDVALTRLLFEILKTDFPRSELQAIDLLLRMFVDPVLELDVPLLEQHLVDLEVRREQALERVKALVGEDVLMSNKKFAEALTKLGVEPPTKLSPTTGKTTHAFGKKDQQFLALLEAENEDVRALVGARLQVKSTLEQTRTRAFLEIASRGALPVPIGYYKAHTGRAAGEDGINMQNLPRGSNLRKAVKAPPGHVLVVADSSQIEARITAWLAGESGLVKDFANGVDIYSKFASLVYGRPVDRKRKERREDGTEYEPDFEAGFLGKACILGLGYSMGWKKLRTTLATGLKPIYITEREAFDAWTAYRTTYRQIVALWNTGDAVLLAIHKGQRFEFGPRGVLYTSAEGIHLPNGMVVRYPHLTYDRGQYFYAGSPREVAEWTRQRLAGKWEPDLLTRIYGGKVIENVVQALARIVVFDQMVDIAGRYRLVLTAHDEAGACVPEEQAQEALQYMLSAMSTPPQWGRDIPIACEGKIGFTYGGAK